MKKIVKRLAVFAMSAVMLVGSTMTVSADTGYTYGYDWWGDVQYSPDAYETIDVYTAVDLGLDKKLSSPEGLYVKGDKIFLCDTGNNRL